MQLLYWYHWRWMCVTWLECVWHDSNVCDELIWCIQDAVRVLISRVWYGPWFVCVTYHMYLIWVIVTHMSHICVMSHEWMSCRIMSCSHVNMLTHICEWAHTHIWLSCCIFMLHVWTSCRVIFQILMCCHVTDLNEIVTLMNKPVNEIDVHRMWHDSYQACCSVLQCVAVWCSVVQRVAYMTWYSSVLQCVAVGYGVLQWGAVWCSVLHMRHYSPLACDCLLQGGAVCCSVLHTWHKSSQVLQCVAAWCMMPCVAYVSWLILIVALSCSVLQSVTVCWSILERVEVCVPNSHARPVWHVICDMKYIYTYEICDMVHPKFCSEFQCVVVYCIMQHMTHSCMWRDVLYVKYMQCVTSHTWMIHVRHMNASCHTDECIMSHVRMHHIKHMIASCHTYECVMSQMNESRHTHEWVILGHDTFEFVMSHMWIRHVTHVNASCHAYRLGDMDKSVAACCSVLQRVAVCCSVSQCVAVCRSVSYLQHEYIWMHNTTLMNPSCHTNRLGDKDKNYVVKVLWTVGECCLDVILSPFFSFLFV